MAEKHNKAIIVIVITLFSKCNISYGKIIVNISNDSAIELLRVKNSYEYGTKTTKNARYANRFASSVHNEIFLTYRNITTHLSGNFQLINQFKMKAIASNKTYEDNGHYKQQFRFKRQDNLLYNENKENPRQSLFTNRLKYGAEDEGVYPPARVIDIDDDLRNEPIALDNLQMNSQKKQKKGTLVNNWKGDAAHFQPRSKFMLPIRGEKLKNKRGKGAVTKDQNYAINNKHHFKRTRFLSNRKKVTINKLLKGAMHINTVRSKQVKMEPQKSIESEWNALEQSSRFDYTNEALHPTTGLNVRNQLPIVTPNVLSSSYHPGTISKLHYQREIDIGQDSQPNGRLDNENNYLSLNYFSNSKATTTKNIIKEKVNVINMGDVFQIPVFQTTKYKLHTQMVIQTDYYLPRFSVVDNSNNISFKSMSCAPSENLNQTVIHTKKKISNQKFKSKKNKNTRYHSKADLSEVFFAQSEKKIKHRKIQQTVVNIKQSRITKKYMKMLSTKYKSKTSKASKKRTSHLRKKGNTKKTVRVIKPSEHRINLKKVTTYVNDNRANSKRLKKMKWLKKRNKKKYNQASSSKRPKQPMNKKHSAAGGKNVKRVNRNTVNEEEITTVDLQPLPTSFLARMGISVSDVVKALKLTNRKTELQYKPSSKKPDNIGGIFNSYHHFWNNNNNHYYFFSSAITDRNVVNNLIVIDFDTSPPTTTTESTTLPFNETTEAPATICTDVPNPTVFFIKKKAVTDYSVVVAALTLVGLALIICCCCGCAPVYILRRRYKCCPPKCCPPKCPEG